MLKKINASDIIADTRKTINNNFEELDKRVKKLEDKSNVKSKK